MPTAGSLQRLFLRCSTGLLLLLSGASLILWAVSGLLGSVGRFSLGGDTSVRFGAGVAEVRHVYAHDIAPAVPHDQWFDYALKRGWATTNAPSTLPPSLARFGPGRFRFQPGLVTGISDGRTASPANYWLLHVPLWATMLPGVIAAGWLLAR